MRGDVTIYPSRTRIGIKRARRESKENTEKGSYASTPISDEEKKTFSVGTKL